MELKEVEGHLAELIEAGASVLLTEAGRVVAELKVAAPAATRRMTSDEVWAKFDEIRARQAEWKGPSVQEWLREAREG